MQHQSGDRVYIRPDLSISTKVKDSLPARKQANVVYEVPCTCGKVYIGETKRRLETRRIKKLALEARLTSQL